MSHSYKRRRDDPDLQAAPVVIPDPAADTPEGRIVDLVLAVDEAKRQRLSMPALINDAQVAQAVLNAHRAIVQEQPDVQTIMMPVMRQIQDIRNRLDGIDTRLDAIANRLDNQENIDVILASAVNNRAVNNAALVRAAPRLTDLQVPDGFPATLGELRSLGGRAINNFLEFYGIPIGGDVDERRDRLFARVGVPLDV